jgi:DNA-binding MarR family transcriptional regulator
LDSLGFLLSQLGYVAARRFHQVMKPVGIDPPHFLVLRFLAKLEGTSQQGMSEMLHIPPSRMVAVVDQLESRGLVERRPNPTDRRARALHLTSAGREMLGRALKAATDHEMSIGATLAPEERRQVIALLQKLAAEMSLLSGVHPDLTAQENGGAD